MVRSGSVATGGLEDERSRGMGSGLMAWDGKGTAMDRLWATPWDDTERERDRSGEPILPSRSAAIEALRPALRSGSGLLLVTGEAGVGKTWLWRRLRSEAPSSWRWAGIDLSPANNVEELYGLIGHALGLDPARGLAGPRLALADFLKERNADGESWCLVVDEGHGLSEGVLEELRLLSNRLNQADGFSAMLLVGQTPLARRLASRTLASLASRITARVHLRPLDVEEARTLLDRMIPDLAWERSVLERVHRETAGNPRQLLRLARHQFASTQRPLPPQPKAPSPAPLPVLDIQAVESRPSQAWEPPVFGPAKPPLRVEDGLIEVGWDPEPEPLTVPNIPSDETALSNPEPEHETETGPEMAAEEAVEDHYAALQAWNEWARNQGRAVAADPVDPASIMAPPHGEDSTAEPPPEEVPVTTTDVWIEGQQTFAPYSQLFSRIRQRNDSN